MTFDAPHARWRAALGPVADEPAGRAVLDELLTRHREPHRRYHTLAHVLAALDALGELLSADATTGADAGALRLALWFHDAVYDARAPGNEEASAVLATERLANVGVTDPLVAEVARLVRLTATHDPAEDDLAGRLVTDADLSILGAPPDRYDRYAADVRAEYAYVDDDAWRAGRAAVLEQFLERARLFRTDDGHARWGAAARVNLRRELARLTGGT